MNMDRNTLIENFNETIHQQGWVFSQDEKVLESLKGTCARVSQQTKSDSDLCVEFFKEAEKIVSGVHYNEAVNAFMQTMLKVTTGKDVDLAPTKVYTPEIYPEVSVAKLLLIHNHPAA
jgi:hypothetical protein